jgi:hypothetical protein
MAAKQSGLGDNFYIGGYDLSGDVSSVDQISGGPALFDVTSIKKSAHERIGGLRDGDLQFTTFFEFGGAGNPVFEHDALSLLPRADTIATYFRGTALQSPVACVNGKQISYDPTRDNTGNLTMKVEVQANGFGTEWGEQLTPGLRPDSGATIGPAITDAAQTAFGAQAYVQLVAFTGTSVTIAVTHATTVGGSYTSLMTTTAMTAIGAQRLSVPNTTTVDQFLKVTTTGTFSSAVFAVAFMRNPVAGVTF